MLYEASVYDMIYFMYYVCLSSTIFVKPGKYECVATQFVINSSQIAWQKRKKINA